MTVGQRIKEIRKLKGLTQQEVGKRMGVTASFIGQYENGARLPKYETLKKIADAIGVSVYTLEPSLSLGYSHLDALPDEARDELGTLTKGDLLIAKILATYLSLDQEGKDDFRRLIDSMVSRCNTSEETSTQQEVLSEFIDQKSEILREKLNDTFDTLTIEGKFVAVERVKELTEIPRYQLQPETPTGDETPPEGKDPAQE